MCQWAIEVNEFVGKSCIMEKLVAGIHWGGLCQRECGSRYRGSHGLTLAFSQLHANQYSRICNQGQCQRYGTHDEAVMPDDRSHVAHVAATEATQSALMRKYGYGFMQRGKSLLVPFIGCYPCVSIESET